MEKKATCYTICLSLISSVNTTLEDVQPVCSYEKSVKIMYVSF